MNRNGYQMRIDAGLCTSCGSQPTTRGLRCERCRARDRDKRAARISAGLCTACGSPAKPGLAVCEPCAAKHLAVTRAFRAKRAAAGMCPYCSAEARDGRKTCTKCGSRKHDPGGAGPLPSNRSHAQALAIAQARRGVIDADGQ